MAWTVKTLATAVPLKARTNAAVPTENWASM
jgi:hypothetical protein